MEQANGDGNGIAWLNSSRRVMFKRGIKLDAIKAILAEIEAKQYPYILHFRIATVGGVHKRLCHPFPITTKQELLFSTDGSTDYVLAQNGHWSEWSEEPCLPKGKLRKGPWSDTAALAYTAAATRNIWLPQGNRIVTLHSQGGLKILAGNWTERDGYSLSNLHWERRSYNYSRNGYINGYEFGWIDEDFDQCSVINHNQTNGAKPNAAESRWETMVRSGYEILVSGKRGHITSNVFACEHGMRYSCAACLPTLNGLPIEIIPKGETLESWDNFTYKENGILQGGSLHPCQHPYGAKSGHHYHCGNCDKQECIELRRSLEADQSKRDKSLRHVLDSHANRQLVAMTNGRTTTVFHTIGRYLTAEDCADKIWCSNASTLPCVLCREARDEAKTLWADSINKVVAIRPASTVVDCCIHSIPKREYCHKCEANEIKAVATIHGVKG